MKQIRASSDENGNILCELDLSKRLLIDVKTGNVIMSTVKEGTDDFRKMVIFARSFHLNSFFLERVIDKCDPNNICNEDEICSCREWAKERSIP